METTENLILSICIPAYNRPLWLQRALVSIIRNTESFYYKFEIIISDDSQDKNCQQIVQKTLQEWPGQWYYIHNQKSLGMAQNWNQSLQLATGDYVLVLHDDDFLLNEAVTKILRILESKRDKYLVFLFGVKVVNEKERVIKNQKVKKPIYLPPKVALKQVLSNSSFVRFPAIVFQRKVLDEIGYFNPDIGGIADLDMWVRLFSRYGVFCLPETTCAYTVHSQALTMNMFTEETIIQLLNLFQQIKQKNLLSLDEMNNCQSLFFHQFILAGTIRFLRRGKLNKAVAVVKLFRIQEINQFQIPKKWLFLRKALEVLTLKLFCIHLVL